MSAAPRVGPADALGAQRPISPCLDADTLLAFYSERLDEVRAEAVREHLSTCSPCLELALDVRRFLGAFQDDASAQPGRRRGWGTRASLGWAAVFLLAVSGLWLAGPVVGPGTRPAPASSPTAVRPTAEPRLEIPVTKAPYAGGDDVVWRGAPERHPPTPLERALEPYLRDDFAEADRRLAAHLERHPGSVPARFYRGVALLMLDRPGQATALLEPLAGRPGPLADEVDWYLALSYIKSGQAGRALPLLDRLGQGRGPRRTAALALRARLDLHP